MRRSGVSDSPLIRLGFTEVYLVLNILAAENCIYVIIVSYIVETFLSFPTFKPNCYTENLVFRPYIICIDYNSDVGYIHTWYALQKGKLKGCFTHILSYRDMWMHGNACPEQHLKLV